MSRLLLLLLSLVSVQHAAAAAPAADHYRGGRVEWARLKTGSPYWNRHSERDVQVLNLMRSVTSLDIGEVWHSASVDNLKELCAHPFIFAESIAPLSKKEGANLAEYLGRGGFLLLDACVSASINPDADRYLAAQIEMLERHLPKLRVEVLKPEHEIFSIYFKMAQFPPQTRSMSNPAWAHGSTEPLRGLFIGDRMIGVISLSGFQCGLAQNPNPGDVVSMITNIYIHAMTR